MGKNAVHSARAPLKIGVAFRGSRLKTDTGVASMLGPSEANVRTGRSFLLAGVEVNSDRCGT